ncbi:MAG: glycosyltransferase family 4 protein [Bacteroidales bacterium]|nr:glycosyltransferase family 4 protein [Bacteroidales bacterium]
MIKIAYVNPDCYVDVDLTILRHLAKEFEVIWYPVYYTDRPIYYTEGQMTAYASQYGIELHLCPRQYRQRDPRNLGFYREIVRDINAHDVALVYSCIVEEVYWTLASRKFKATRILGLHDVVMHSFGKPVKRFIQTAIRELTISRSPNVCVFSGNQRDLFLKRHGRDAVELGLASRFLGKSSASLPDISDGVRLLFFGNIIQYKGLDLLIETMEKLRSEGITNLRLTVAGAGDYWSVCECQLKTPEMYDLKVRFIDNDEIPDLLASHHFMALPYRDATQSGPLMLAAGGGMPVLAPDFGCFKDNYDSNSAVLYSDLMAGLRRIAAMTSGEYSLMRGHAGMLARLFSEETVADRYIQYFNSLLATCPL